MLNIQQNTIQGTELHDPGAVGGECTPGKAVLLEWRCLEVAHLVQDQEAKSQEGGELPEAHHASLCKGNIMSPSTPFEVI